MDQFGINAQHSFGQLGVHRRRFEQADVQRRLADTAPLIQSPAHRLSGLTCSRLNMLRMTMINNLRLKTSCYSTVMVTTAVAAGIVATAQMVHWAHTTRGNTKTSS